MEELRREMEELAYNAQQCLYDGGVFTRAQLTQAVARLADVVSELCSIVIKQGETMSEQQLYDVRVGLHAGEFAFMDISNGVMAKDVPATLQAMRQRAQNRQDYEESQGADTTNWSVSYLISLPGSVLFDGHSAGIVDRWLKETL